MLVLLAKEGLFSVSYEYRKENWLLKSFSFLLAGRILVKLFFKFLSLLVILLNRMVICGSSLGAISLPGLECFELF
jgi:hypothetical protein